LRFPADQRLFFHQPLPNQMSKFQVNGIGNQRCVSFFIPFFELLVCLPPELPLPPLPSPRYLQGGGGYHKRFLFFFPRSLFSSFVPQCLSSCFLFFFRLFLHSRTLSRLTLSAPQFFARRARPDQRGLLADNAGFPDSCFFVLFVSLPPRGSSKFNSGVVQSTTIPSPYRFSPSF